MSKLSRFWMPLCILVLIFGCFKQGSHPSPDQLQNKDQQAVNAWLATQKTTSVTAEQTQWLESLKTALDFQHAERTAYDAYEDFLLIPLQSSGEITTQRSGVLQGTQTLLIIIDKTGNILSGKILVFSGNQKGQMTDLVKHLFTCNPGYNTGFSGTVSVLKLSKNVLFQAVYTNGIYRQRKTYATTKDLITQGVPSQKLIASTVRPADQICIDWYLVISDGDTGDIIGEQYLYTDCVGDAGGDAGSEGIDQWKDAVTAGVQSPRLCGTVLYNMLDQGTSFGMQIDNLRMSLAGPNGAFVNADLGSACVTIPNNGGISASTASRDFVAAYNMAVNDIINGLNAGTILDKDGFVSNAFKNAIATRLAALVPGATVTFGTGCPGGVPINDAQYC